MAKLEKTYTAAKIVETYVEDMLLRFEPYEESNEVILSTPYVNCREKGFCFSQGFGNDQINIFVAEHRCSDSIIVIMHKGGYGYEDVTDEDYEKAEFFNYNKHYQAAERVCQLLFNRGKKYGWRHDKFSKSKVVSA